MITKPYTRKTTIYESAINETDIADTIFDFGTYFEYCEKNPSDYYDKLMQLFALNIKIDYYNGNTLICHIADFIDENRKAFDTFMNEVNSDDYAPKSYDYIEKESEEFYDLYMQTFEHLCIGDYGFDDYKYLYKLLTGEKQ